MQPETSEEAAEVVMLVAAVAAVMVAVEPIEWDRTICPGCHESFFSSTMFNVQRLGRALCLRCYRIFLASQPVSWLPCSEVVCRVCGGPTVRPEFQLDHDTHWCDACQAVTRHKPSPFALAS